MDSCTDDWSLEVGDKLKFKFKLSGKIARNHDVQVRVLPLQCCGVAEWVDAAGDPYSKLAVRFVLVPTD